MYISQQPLRSVFLYLFQNLVNPRLSTKVLTSVSYYSVYLTGSLTSTHINILLGSLTTAQSYFSSTTGPNFTIQ